MIYSITVTMGKPKGYDVHNPESEPVESKKERKVRERREKKFRDAAFAATPERLQLRLESLPRHTRFDDVGTKGGRSAQKRWALRDAEG